MERSATDGQTGSGKPTGDRRRLGSIEYCWKKTDDFAPLVFVGVLKLARGPSPQTLRRALDALQKLHPLLAVSLETAGKDHFFRMHRDPPPIPLTLMKRAGPEHWRQVAEDELNERIDSARPPMMRFTYLHEGPQGDIVFSVHHSIIDSRSGAEMVRNLLETCATLEAGREPAPARSDGAFPPQMEDRFPDGFRGWRGLLRTAGFLARQMAVETRYRRRLGKRQTVPSHNSARCRILSLELSVEATAELARAVRRHRIPLNSVLHATMLLALARHAYPGAVTPMRGIAFADMRPFLAPPIDAETMGVYISLLQYTLDVGPDADLWRLAKAIRDQLLAATKNGDKFIAARLGRHLIDFMIARRSMRLGMVALSYPGPLDIADRYGTIEVAGLHGFISNNMLGPELAGFGKIMGGRLGLDLQYLDCDMDPATAVAVGGEVQAILNRATVEKVAMHAA